MASVNDVVLTLTFSLLSLTDFVGNISVCLIILQRKRFRFRRLTLDYLFVNLALADITVAVFAIPRYVLNHAFVHPLGSFGDFLCRFVTGGNLMWTGGAASVFTLVTIAFERRHASRPYQVGQRLSKPKLRVLVLSSWIFACLLNLPLFVIMSYDSGSNFCIENWPHPLLPKVYGIIWISVVGVIPIAIMVVLYSEVVYRLWGKTRVARLNRGSLLIPRKATRIAVTLTVIYSICWLPNLILYILVFNISYILYGSPLYGWTVVLTCLNSTVNPFVYTLQSRRFRASAKRALLCK